MTTLTRDQEQRLFREHLKGERPEKEMMEKYGLTAAEHLAIIKKYSVAEHPNDVGNAPVAQQGDVVSNVDTGSGATEKPIVAKTSRELSVEYVEGQKHKAEAEALAQAYSQAGRSENLSKHAQVLKEKKSANTPKVGTERTGSPDKT